uniref:Neprosin PEP catalytic domain-containing protein n=1 Tax=Aegilops tauschii subsp. strangulata TaxID=200361 RepID=A0A453RGT3_AEGTS
MPFQNHCSNFQEEFVDLHGKCIMHDDERSGTQDPKHGHWWLELGPGVVVGYWPSGLFTHLAHHARMVQFGGEVVNTRPPGSHTATQMGSGHFPGEGFDRAAYFRNLQVVDWDNNIIRASGLKLLADHPGCYDIQGGFNGRWGTYFYYGGPGRNVKCP